MFCNLGRSIRHVVSASCLLAAITFTVHAQPLTVTTLAGPTGGAGWEDGTGSAARFHSAPASVGSAHDHQGVAIDSAGNLVVADTFNHTIRKVTPAGVVTTLAGLAGASGSADGNGSAARFNLPEGVAVDGDGNVYVADTYNHTIRKITPARVVTTLAGVPGHHGSHDGSGRAALFWFPAGIATDGGGNLYVGDKTNHTIRKITPAGLVTTLAGSPADLGSEDGAASAAGFSYLGAVATDSAGNVYVADGINHTIRKITPRGAVTTLAGSHDPGKADGRGSAARFKNPQGVATDRAGNVYVADTENSTIRKISPEGIVTTLAGSPGLPGPANGTGSAAGFSYPGGVVVDGDGNVYVTDTGNNQIRKITPVGVVTTLAGSASISGSTDGTVSAARFNACRGVATDSGGNVYVADTGNHTIRKITPAGVVTTLAGLAGVVGSADGTGKAARFHDPDGVATDAVGNIYVSDSADYTIRKITRAGVVTTLAGSAGVSGDAEGTGSDARFKSPRGMAIDRGGSILVADGGNHKIRMVTPDGVVSSVANVRYPNAVATDSAGALYVTAGYVIGKITPSGEMATVAGSGGVSGSADGTGNEALFYNPDGLAIDGGGNVYVADSTNDTIRKMTPSGVVTTVAGSPRVDGSADGTGSEALFYGPNGLAIDGGGNVYVADAGNHRIRVGRPALAGVATIDSPTGVVGSPRQLNTSSQAAKNWQWRIVRQPSGSTAMLSSASVANPSFTPDVADLYVFQLIASNGEKMSITNVSLMASASPAGH